jgi:Putative peptidoglycan binding domain
MLPFLILIPVGWLLWKLGENAGRHETVHYDVSQAVEDALARRGHAQPAPVSQRLHPMLPPAPPRPESNTVAQYLEHLHECMMAAAALNTVRPAAINADMNALMNASDDAVYALAVLSRPMDTLTVQRDLNVLGANPPIPETGVRDAQTIEAIKGLQESFKQQPTGAVDPATAVAIRYSVGVVHGQNQTGQA